MHAAAALLYDIQAVAQSTNFLNVTGQVTVIFDTANTERVPNVTVLRYCHKTIYNVAMSGILLAQQYECYTTRVNNCYCVTVVNRRKEKLHLRLIVQVV
jgi:hypothetical protein